MKACPACGSAKVAEAAMLPSIRLDHATCWACGFTAKLEAWNALLRPADIVAARIEGLREGVKIVQEEFFMKPRDNGYESWETPCFDDVEPVLNARIAELEATAPEVSETRAKAEAFDAALALFKDSDDDNAWWLIKVMDEALAEAKRKGAGT